MEAPGQYVQQELPNGAYPGGVILPLLSNIYLTEVDRMLERAPGRTTR